MIRMIALFIGGAIIWPVILLATANLAFVVVGGLIILGIVCLIEDARRKKP